jgi:hypothetical protein
MYIFIYIAVAAHEESGAIDDQALKAEGLQCIFDAPFGL